MSGGLMDVAQSASNAVAGNVSGPVDLLAFLLRKAGVPVPEDPVGGTEWMRRKGLIRDVPQGSAQVAGETLGLLAPVVAAAKAPQIARGLLQAADNAAAPRTMRPDAGAIVWHGSPHKFDRFDSSKIGTGEGRQVYGHGLYLAESPKVAMGYRASVPPKAGQQFGLEDGPVKGIATLIAARGDEGEAMARKAYAGQVQNIDAAIAQAKSAIENASSLYKVDLPDEQIARMLDWDKPLSQQAPVVQKAVFGDIDEAIEITKKSLATASERRAPTTAAELEKLTRERARLLNLSGGDYYRQKSLGVTAGQPASADGLRALGIPGIRYLDGGSRGAGTGTSNFVVFPGNEGLLTILERNGIPLGR